MSISSTLTEHAQRNLFQFKNRLVSRRYGRALVDELFGCLLGLPLNKFVPQGLEEDFLYNAQGELSLHSDTIWIEECGGYVPADGYTYVQGDDCRIVEVYIDDMVVKRRKKLGHAHDLVNVFDILR